MEDLEIKKENTTNEVDIDWDDLYGDLKDNRAILILGPEFYASDGLSVKEQLYYELIKREDHGIIHFYPSNGIFLFQSERYKNKAQKFSCEFYKKLEGDESIMQKISELPFRMIINTNPDKILQRKYGTRAQYDYFTWRLNKKVNQIVEPDSYFPLIFNLFGSIDSFESIVLDFEDIFDHLKSLLNNINVSDIIRSVLKETDTFIFVGFHLEKWDTQLLFRYLNMKDHCFDDSKKNYTTRSLNIDNSSESFFRKQFNIKYYGAPVDFLDEIHTKYCEIINEEERLLMQGLSTRGKIEYYISKNKIENAIKILDDHIQNNETDLADTFLLVQQKFSGYCEAMKNQDEDRSVLDDQRRAIKKSILGLSKSLQA